MENQQKKNIIIMEMLKLRRTQLTHCSCQKSNRKVVVVSTFPKMVFSVSVCVAVCTHSFIVNSHVKHMFNFLLFLCRVRCVWGLDAPSYTQSKCFMCFVHLLQVRVYHPRLPLPLPLRTENYRKFSNKLNL